MKDRYTEILQGKIEDFEAKSPNPGKRSADKYYVNIHGPKSQEKEAIHYTFEERQMME